MRLFDDSEVIFCSFYCSGNHRYQRKFGLNRRSEFHETFNDSGKVAFPSDNVSVSSPSRFFPSSLSFFLSPSVSPPFRRPNEADRQSRPTIDHQSRHKTDQHNILTKGPWSGSCVSIVFTGIIFNKPHRHLLAIQFKLFPSDYHADDPIKTVNRVSL